MNLNKIKQWAKNKLSQYESDFDLLEEIDRLRRDRDRVKYHRNKARDECIDLEEQNEGKRIALIFITTLLVMSLVGNAIQFFN